MSAAVHLDDAAKQQLLCGPHDQKRDDDHRGVVNHRVAGGDRRRILSGPESELAEREEDPDLEPVEDDRGTHDESDFSERRERPKRDPAGR